MQKKIRKFIIFLIILVISLLHSSSYAMTIVLDPGHGGADSGAVNGTTYESDITLKIARYLKQYLEAYDVNVRLTHNGLTQDELSVYDRSMIARNAKADLLVSLHINSSTSSNLNGAEVYVTANTSLDKYYKNTASLGNKILENLGKLGIASRGVLTKQLERDTTDVYSDGTMADYYGIIRYAMRGTKIDDGVLWPTNGVSANIQNGEGVPAILVEHCFIKGSDYAFVDSDKDIAKLARADADAIISHYGLSKEEDIKVTIQNVKEISGIITKIPKETAKAGFEKNFAVPNGYSVKVENNSTYIGTGTKVEVINNKSNTTAKTYGCIVYGDTNGDGKITSSDYVLIKNHIMETNTLTGIHGQAADVNRDNKTSASDYVLIKNHIMNGTKLEIE